MQIAFQGVNQNLLLFSYSQLFSWMPCTASMPGSKNDEDLRIVFTYPQRNEERRRSACDHYYGSRNRDVCSRFLESVK